MADYRIISRIVPDDHTDGFFWREGERWLRENGKEVRTAGYCRRIIERAFMMEGALDSDSPYQRARL